jgi:hypothetical protein
VRRRHRAGGLYYPRVSGFDSLTRLLDAAEASAPVDAVSAVTREVGKRLRAASVSFLIADTSGRALVRLVHESLGPTGQAVGVSMPEAGHRMRGEESARTVPFDGGPMERVVRSQRPEVIPPAAAGWAGRLDGACAGDRTR